MKLRHIIILAILALSVSTLSAHPGSGIVVGKDGTVYFVDTGSGLWKIAPDGTLSRISGPAYHWMAIDGGNRLKDVRLPNFSRGGAVVERAENPSLILSSDFPIAVGPNGDLYYPWLSDDDRLQVFRLSPAGKTTVVKTLGGHLQWLNGLVVGHDGSVYYTENDAVRKITPKGELVTVAEKIRVSHCDPVPGVPDDHLPYLRGLDIGPDGSVYAAINGCRMVIKIDPEGTITTLLQAESPWSPTAIAVHGKDLYVLEYLHRETDDRRDWAPRVRRISGDGTVKTIAIVER